ncbi:MAG: hypothetical protein UIC63_06600 [Bacteroidaceae bacterium]|nr:hypothetical protein [Bacteroidaceae bacterium]
MAKEFLHKGGLTKLVENIKAWSKGAFLGKDATITKSSGANKGVSVSIQGSVSEPSVSVSVTTSGVSGNNSGVVSGSEVKAYVDENAATKDTFKAATSSSNAVNGLVPAPSSANATKFLRGDGTWTLPKEITVSNSSATLAWDSAVSLATVNGTDITAKLPKNPQRTYLTGEGLYESTANTFSVKPATSSSIGGLKTGYTQNGKSYPVRIDINNDAYVEVPWTDTTYQPATTSSKGLMSSTDKKNLDALSGGVSLLIANGVYTYNDLKSKLDEWLSRVGTRVGAWCSYDGAFDPESWDKGTDIIGNGGTITLTISAVTSWFSTDYVQMRVSSYTNTSWVVVRNNKRWLKPEKYALLIDKIPSTSASSRGVSVALGGTVGSPTVSVTTTTGGVSGANSGVVSGKEVKDYVDANAATKSVFSAATSSSVGSNGLVPAPSSANVTKFLRGDGTWQTPTITKDSVTSALGYTPAKEVPNTMVWGGILNTAAYAADYAVGTVLKVTTSESLHILKDGSLITSSLASGTNVIVSHESYMSGSSYNSGKVFVIF